MLYNKIVEYVKEREEVFNIFHITRKFRIGYIPAQFYVDKMLEDEIIREAETAGITNLYKKSPNVCLGFYFIQKYTELIALCRCYIKQLIVE